MSYVTTAILYAGDELRTDGEQLPAQIQALNLRVERWGYFSALDDAFGGWKVCDTVYGAALNNINLDELFQAFLITDWPRTADRGWTSDVPRHRLQLWLKGESEPEFTVYTIDSMRAHLAEVLT